MRHLATPLLPSSFHHRRQPSHPISLRSAQPSRSHHLHPRPRRLRSPLHLHFLPRRRPCCSPSTTCARHPITSLPFSSSHSPRHLDHPIPFQLSTHPLYRVHILIIAEPLSNSELLTTCVREPQRRDEDSAVSDPDCPHLTRRSHSSSRNLEDKANESGAEVEGYRSWSRSRTESRGVGETELKKIFARRRL